MLLLRLGLRFGLRFGLGFGLGFGLLHRLRRRLWLRLRLLGLLRSLRVLLLRALRVDALALMTGPRLLLALDAAVFYRLASGAAEEPRRSPAAAGALEHRGCRR